MKEKEKILKTDWLSNFTLVGEAKVGDYTFDIDKRSEKSGKAAWVYNSLNLNVFCGDGSGDVFCTAMGGYSEGSQNVIYAHGKKEDGTDDFDNRMEIAWEDRLDETILEGVGDLCFFTVGLEKTDKDKTFYKKFLSQYDAIAYIKEHLEDGMVVNVKGNLKYSEYNGNVNVKKNITSIVLSKVEDSSKYKASFTQSILLDKDSVDMKDVDKDTGVLYVPAMVLDYLKEKNGIEVKGQYPFVKTFEYEFDLSKPDLVKKIYEKLFKVKKGITQITFEGVLVEGGAVVQATMDDIPDDIKDLIEIGVYTEEEALARCSTNGNRIQRMVLRKPYIKLVTEDKVPVLLKTEERYTDEDLDFSYLNVEKEEEKVEESSESEEDSMSWLEAL